jgi:hypothetical protein
MRFHAPLFLLLLASSFAGSTAQTAEDTLPAKAEQARVLFMEHRDSEAALLARQILLQKPEGRRSNELRILLCKAKAAGADVGDPLTVYPEAGDPRYPGLMPPSAQPPERISGRKPRLGSKAKAADGGQVIVTAVIDVDGCVQDPTIVRGLNPDADQDILKAVRDWVFRPALFEGKPIKVPYQLAVLL